ncbi:MAG: acetyl-CoA hydrolase/transferase, partial [Firmicutes bacterium]|nr:acetyl-CoA hydrolase/transferase [Bacillota bacterium]
MSWKELYRKKTVTCGEAVQAIKPGNSVWLSPNASNPKDLVMALCNRHQELKDVDVWSSLLMHPFEFLKKEYRGQINYHSYFPGQWERKFMSQGNVSITSFHLSLIDKLINDVIKPNVALLEVSPPNEQGYMCLSVGGIFADRLNIDFAQTVIAQVNRKAPYIYGQDNLVHISEVDYIVEKDHLLPELLEAPPTKVDKKIASYIIDQIPDGATIQIGIGGIANAVGYGLEGKKDLGLHTEMISNCLVYLAKKGVINCSKKNFLPGKMVICFALGSQELYDFLDHNPLIHAAPVHWVNNYENIAKNDNFISLNGALMVDLTGQVCSESLGFNQFSSTGGQLDFVAGATRSKGGKSFIVMPSTVEKVNGTESRIHVQLPPGAVITTPRASVQYIVTEYGIADLFNKSIPARVKEMIKITHPDFKEQL